jgi:hypothetical protein
MLTAMLLPHMIEQDRKQRRIHPVVVRREADGSFGR